MVVAILEQTERVHGPHRFRPLNGRCPMCV